MPTERVTIIAGGKEFEGWKQVTIIAAVNQAARAARFEVTEVPNDPMMPPESFFEKWHFPPFTPVEVHANGTLMLKGFVESYEPSMGPDSHSVNLQLASDSIDMVFSSVTHETGEFEEKTAEQISKELIAPTGVKFKVEGKRKLNRMVNIFRVMKGATVFSEVIRLYQAEMATLKGNADGSVSAVTGVLGSHGAMLAHGKNIIQMSAKITGSGLASEVMVDGQGDGTLFEDDLQAEEKARDPMVPRPGRKKVIIHQNEPTKQGLENRAAWEVARARGFSVTAQILVPSWRDDTGKLWEPGFTTHVYAPGIKVDRALMIEQVEFRQDDQGGSVAQLQMVNPAAYGGESGESGDGDLFEFPDTPIDGEGNVEGDIIVGDDGEGLTE